jgi:uncharacterized SAM-binding protein YcdF (DUF218 family)
MLTDRERFLVTLAYQRPSHADVIVCLAGEDGENRAFDAAELFKAGKAPGILVTGGRHEGAHMGAAALKTLILGRGIAHDRIVVDDVPQNTREQAVETVALALVKGWKRLILCASTYHQPRAFLTFLRALQEAKQDETICIAHYPVRGADDFDGRLARDIAKIEAYGDHCASYADGLAALARWAT